MPPLKNKHLLEQAPFEPVTVRWFAVALLCLLTLSYWFFVSGVRGTDQNWYLADTQTLLEGGSEHTNTVFPGMVLRQQIANPETYFVHNGPLLYAASALAQVTGAFHAWKVLNYVFWLCTAILVGVSVQKLLSSASWGYIAFSAALCAPIAVWQAANLLIESYLGFVLALAMALFLREKNSALSRWLLMAVLLLGQLSHPIFAILAGAYVIKLFVTRHNAGAVVQIALIVVAGFLKAAWFPSSFQPDLASIVAASVPGVSNMLWHYTESLDPISFNLMLSKVIDGVRMQFFTVSMVPLYIVTNASMVAFCYLLVQRQVQHWRVLLMYSVAIGSYFGIVFLMQNQPRYQVIIMPLAITICVIFAANFSSSRIFRALLLSGICVFAMADIYLLRKVNLEAYAMKTALSNISLQLGKLAPEQTVALVDDRANSLISVVRQLRPNKTMLMDTRYLSNSKAQEALGLFNPDYVVTRNEEYLKLLHGFSEAKRFSTKYYGEMIVYIKSAS